jgi:two-component system sensor histidine kinase KdpD
MLAQGSALAAQGVDVVVAHVETHHRPDTESLLEGMEQIPPKGIDYRGTRFEEMDTDAVITRKPDVALVDELAHTNVPGGRHAKRWQDVEDVLEAGIDVITNVNAQHLESLAEAAESLTGTKQRECVPDAAIAAADVVELIDVDPRTLRRRLSEHGVMTPDMAERALGGYFTGEHLEGLRALAVGWLEDHDLPAATSATVARPPGERVVVALTGDPEGEHIVRRAAQIAATTRAELVGLHARLPTRPDEEEPVWLESQRRLLAELGGRFAEVAADDVATAVLEFADAEHASQLVLGATRRSRVHELLHGSVINRAIRHAGTVEVHVLPPRHAPELTPERRPAGRLPRVPLPARRRQAAFALAFVAPSVVLFALAPLHAAVGLAGALFLALVAVAGVAALGGVVPAAVATVVGFVLADFFFATPLHSLRVDRVIDLVALVAYVAVAGMVGVLVDVLARQGLRSARAQAIAASLARLVANTVVVAPRAIDPLPSTLRRAFDLRAVALLRSAGGRWVVADSSGGPVPDRPEDATYAVELPDRSVLALVASGATGVDSGQLEAFVNGLHLAEERTQLERLNRHRRSASHRR